MKEINAEIISLGTELLLGQICNSNAEWLSDHLSNYGINVFYHTVVGDNVNRVENIFSQAQTRSNLVIVTGGLGPTEDDMTRDAFQKITGLALREDQTAIKKIVAFFEKHDREMTPNNRKQALVFEDAKVLFNDEGMAPGMIVEYKGVHWVFLPGVPREMKEIFQSKVKPYLFQLSEERQIIKSKMLRFIGIGEAELEHKLSKLISKQTNPTIAPLAQERGMALRLTVKSNSELEAEEKLNQSKQEVLKLVEPYYYGEEEDTVAQVVIDLLKQEGLTIASAESLTGGLFASELVSVEGVSSVIPGSIVTYDASIKEKLLSVSSDTIANEGVVSEQCALEMARNVRKMFQTNIGISFTGVAGPDQLENKEVGLTYIGLCTDQFSKAYQFTFNGNRNQIRKRAVLKGLEIIFGMLKT